MGLCVILGGAVAIGGVVIDFVIVRIKLRSLLLTGTRHSLSLAVTSFSAVTTVAWNAVNTVSLMSWVVLVVGLVTVSLESTLVYWCWCCCLYFGFSLVLFGIHLVQCIVLQFYLHFLWALEDQRHPFDCER